MSSFRVSVTSRELIARDVPAGARAILQEVLAFHRWQVQWTTVDPRAHFGQRTIFTPPITDARSALIGLHEAGHVVAGPCPAFGRGAVNGHRSSGKGSCLACENRAWDFARRCLPLTRETLRHLQRALDTYRWSSTGLLAPQSAWDEAARHASEMTYADERLQRARDDLRTGRLAEAVNSLARAEEALAPTLARLRWLKQAEIDLARDLARFRGEQ